MAENVSAELIDLVDRIGNGESDAEASLYERYAARVYYVALRGSGSTHDADDVRSETFLRVLTAIRAKQLRSGGALPAFILGVTRNVLNELYARRRQRGERVEPDKADLSAPSHERSFLDREVRLAIEQTIDQLNERDRAVLRMYFFDDLPTEEVARRAGIAAERVRLVKSRALKRFREAYQRLSRAGRQQV